MVESGEKLYRNADLRGYFGVGSPVPAPYEQNCERLHKIDALLLTALGKHGLGDADGAKKALDELVTLEPENMKLCFMRMVGIL